MQYFDELDTDGEMLPIEADNNRENIADTTLFEVLENVDPNQLLQEALPQDDEQGTNLEDAAPRDQMQDEKHLEAQPITLVDWTIRKLAKGGICVEGIRKFV